MAWVQAWSAIKLPYVCRLLEGFCCIPCLSLISTGRQFWCIEQFWVRLALSTISFHCYFHFQEFFDAVQCIVMHLQQITAYN